MVILPGASFTPSSGVRTGLHRADREHRARVENVTKAIDLRVERAQTGGAEGAQRLYSDLELAARLPLMPHPGDDSVHQ